MQSIPYFTPPFCVGPSFQQEPLQLFYFNSLSAAVLHFRSYYIWSKTENVIQPTFSKIPKHSNDAVTILLPKRDYYVVFCNTVVYCNTQLLSIGQLFSNKENSIKQRIPL